MTKNHRHTCLFSLVLLVLCALVSISYANNLAIVPQKATETLWLGPVSNYFEDKTGANSFFQAQNYFNNNSDLAGKKLLPLGNIGGVYWWQLQLQNPYQADTWWLVWEPENSWRYPAHIAQVDVYNTQNNGILLARFNSQFDQSVPEKNYYRRLQTPNVPITMAANTVGTYIIMIKTSVGVNSSIEPRLLSQQGYIKHQTLKQPQSLLFWFGIGLLVSICLVFAVLTRQLRLCTILGYVLLVATYLAWRHLWLPSTPEWQVIIAQLRTLPIAWVLPWLVGLSALCVSFYLSHAQHTRRILSVIFFTIASGGAAILAKPQLLGGFLPSADTLSLYALAIIGLTTSFAAAMETIAFKRGHVFIAAWLLLILLPIPSIAPIFILGPHLCLIMFAMWQHVMVDARKADALNVARENELRAEMTRQRIDHEREKLMFDKRLESDRSTLNDLRHKALDDAKKMKDLKQVAENANQSKSNFLAMISHEIRTPLTGILGMIHLTEQTNLNPQQKEYVETIRYSGETLLTLLNDVLDLSKIEQGKLSLENIPFALRPLVNSVQMLMSGRAREKGLSIYADIAADAAEQWHGDPNRLRQILINLLSNAIKFTENGSVTIKVGPKTDNPNWLRFEVIDTGTGISSEGQAKLFKAYSQTDASIARKYGGTGLGLNICRNLVEAMGGQIGVSSVIGEGSNFWFDIPQAELSAEETTTQQQTKHISEGAIVSPLLFNSSDNIPPTSTLANPKRALVVDDNPVNVRVIQGLLELEGWLVSTASSGVLGLEELAKTQFDVIFTDWLMPVLDGPAFTKKVRAWPEKAKAQTPIFAITGLEAQDIESESIACGMQGILSKPVTPLAIRRTLQNLSHIDPAQIKTNIDPDNLTETTDMGIKETWTKLQNAYTDLKQGIALGLHSEDITPEEASMLPPKIATTQPSVEDIKDDGEPHVYILDMTMIGDLKDSLAPETFNNIFGDLSAKAAELWQDFLDAVHAHDLPDASQNAHNLKGMAANFGLNALAKACGKMEKLSKDNDMAQIKMLLPRAQQVFDETQKALDDFLKGDA